MRSPLIHHRYTNDEIAALLAENDRLKREVEFMRGHPTLAKGIRGETIFAKLLRATRAARGSPHDLVTRGGEFRLEVKYSSLLRTYSNREGRRWVWTKLFGEMGNKQFDRLLLIGDLDPQFRDTYLDPGSPYVIFDLPYQDALELADGAQPGRRSRLHLTTNPQTVTSWKSRALFNGFQVQVSELLRRYEF
jgi:hypothetical protein